MGQRQNPRPNSAIPLMESYTDFSGGLNSEISNEKLKDSEYPILENADLAGRGSAKARYGRTEAVTSYPYNTSTSVAQGIFPFYIAGQVAPDLIHAVNGQLYVQKAGQTTLTAITMTDGTFQTTLQIDAVQYQGTLFLATGTKFMELNYSAGTYTCKAVVPYKPTNQEAIFIGTNGLDPNPNSYVQDLNTATIATAWAIAPDARVGWVQHQTTFTGYYNAPSGWSIDYQWEYKKSSDTAWVIGQAFATGAAGKTFKFTPDTAVPYDFRLTVRQTGQAPTNTTTLNAFQIQQTAPAALLSTAAMNKCRKILLHWDRILLTQDDTNAYQMYISDLLNPRYFPTTNTISFDFGKQEPITSLVRFRDMLVIFTNSTVQTLTGKSVADYKRSLIHDGIGCVADRSARVIGNEIIFLSSEGLWKLKPNPFILEMMNVSRADFSIKTDIAALVGDSNACSITADGMYWLCFPSTGVIYRYYYDDQMWVRDTSMSGGSNPLKFSQFLMVSNTVYNQSTTGRVYKHDKSVFTDNGDTFTMVVESKFLDLSASFNYKTLRKLHVLAKHYKDHTVDISTTVQADSAFVLTPETGSAVIDPVTNTTTWQKTIAPNLHFQQGTQLGTWKLGDGLLGDIALTDQKAAIRGKCHRVKVRFEYSGGKACEIYGFGLEFRLKKP